MVSSLSGKLRHLNADLFHETHAFIPTRHVLPETRAGVETNQIVVEWLTVLRARNAHPPENDALLAVQPPAVDSGLIGSALRFTNDANQALNHAAVGLLCHLSNAPPVSL